MRIRVLFSVLILVAAVQCRAQEKIGLFGGYSFVRGAIEVRLNNPLIPAHESVGPSNTAAFVTPGSQTGVAFAIGGGIDVKTAPLVSFRLIQLDYLYTHLYGRSQSQPRLSAGVVLHF